MGESHSKVTSEGTALSARAGLQAGISSVTVTSFGYVTEQGTLLVLQCHPVLVRDDMPRGKGDKDSASTASKDRNPKPPNPKALTPKTFNPFV